MVNKVCLLLSQKVTQDNYALSQSIHWYMFVSVKYVIIILMDLTYKLIVSHVCSN